MEISGETGRLVLGGVDMLASLRCILLSVTNMIAMIFRKSERGLCLGM